MKIEKEYNERGKCYNFKFINEEKKLDILYGGTLDLYLMISDNKIMEPNMPYSIDFDITKENYELFSIFDRMYKRIISGNVYDDKGTNYRSSFQYNHLVDKNKKITWVSDDDSHEFGDRFTLEKNDEDSYKLNFIRSGITSSDSMKNGWYISVRIRNSGSRYDPFNVIFMKMFQELHNIDTEYHQIHFEEVLYQEKVLKKELKK